jgi:alpha-beta hydrolase superfamily lysophospholipase
LAVYGRWVGRLADGPPVRLKASAFNRIDSAVPADLPTLQTLRLNDGSEIPYRRYEAERSHTVLILVHGSGGFGDQFAPLAGTLAGNGVAEVYTPDLRGHGEWAGSRGRAVNYPEQLVDDLEAFIAWVKAARPDARIVLGGHSAAGGLVLALSERPAAEAISGYLLLAPYLGVQSPANRPNFGGWLRLSRSRIYLIGALNALGVRWLNRLPVLWFDVSHAADPRYCRKWSMNTMLAFGPGAFAERLQIPATIPVLLIAGDDDDCFDPILYPQAIAPIAPHAEIVSAGAVGHWDLLVDASVPEAIARWLAEQGLKDLLRVSPPRSPPDSEPIRKASQ